LEVISLSTASITFPLFGEDFIINTPGYISVFGFRLYLYGLFITAGFVLAGVYMYVRRDMLKLTKDNVLDLIILAVPCGLLGARIYYILFNASQYIGPGKWQNIIMFREGGLAVYGGVIGGAIAFYVYSRIKKIPIGKLLDAAGFGLLIGQAVGRWGNFFNREAYGVGTDLPWRMGLTTNTGTIYVHPTFLYESLWNIAGLAMMHYFSKKTERKYNGQYFLFYIAWYGLGRFMIEGLRTDSLFVYGTDIRVSQLLAALSLAVAVLLLVRNRLRGYAITTVAGIPDPEPVLAFEGASASECAADADDLWTDDDFESCDDSPANDGSDAVSPEDPEKDPDPSDDDV